MNIFNVFSFIDLAVRVTGILYSYILLFDIFLWVSKSYLFENIVYMIFDQDNLQVMAFIVQFLSCSEPYFSNWCNIGKNSRMHEQIL